MGAQLYWFKHSAISLFAGAVNFKPSLENGLQNTLHRVCIYVVSKGKKTQTTSTAVGVLSVYMLGLHDDDLSQHIPQHGFHCRSQQRLLSVLYSQRAVCLGFTVTAITVISDRNSAPSLGAAKLLCSCKVPHSIGCVSRLGLLAWQWNTSVFRQLLWLHAEEDHCRFLINTALV